MTPTITSFFPVLLALALPTWCFNQTTVMLTPNKDNSIYDESTNSNALGDLFAGRNGGGDIRRALLSFDVSGIPSNATITAVNLKLNKNKGGASSITGSLHKLLADWGEGTSFAGGGSGAGQGGGDGASPTTGDATWQHRFFNTMNWSTNGGDFESTASASINMGTAHGIHTWSSNSMIADVQAWVSNSSTNFGWILRISENTSSSASRFNSREDSSNKPLLTVTYTVPPCPPNLHLDGTIASGTYEASQSITADGTILNGSVVFMKTGGTAELQDNFTADLGSVLEITLDGCP